MGVEVSDQRICASEANNLVERWLGRWLVLAFHGVSNVICGHSVYWLWMNSLVRQERSDGSIKRFEEPSQQRLLLLASFHPNALVSMRRFIVQCIETSIETSQVVVCRRLLDACFNVSMCFNVFLV
jgi:hypothetical protein